MLNLKSCLAGSDAAGEVYHIAYGGHEYLIDIYYLLADALGVNADINKARKVPGYKPEWTFEQEVQAAKE